MRLRAHRRNLVLWSQSASSIGRYVAPPFTRTRRIRRWIRIGALLTVVGLRPLARAGRARWRLLLAGGVLTVVGVMLGGGLGGVISCSWRLPRSSRAALRRIACGTRS